MNLPLPTDHKLTKWRLYKHFAYEVELNRKLLDVYHSFGHEAQHDLRAEIHKRTLQRNLDIALINRNNIFDQLTPAQQARIVIKKLTN